MSCDLSPFQVGVHEPLPADWMNARVKYFVPEDWAVLEMLGVAEPRYVS